MKDLMDNEEQWYNKPLNRLINWRQSTVQEGLIGIEIEAEGKNLFSTPFTYWSCHPDGSLRSTDKIHPPQEYVLKKPLSREEIVKALHYLNSKFIEAKSELIFSNRTSVHIHLNCQNYTVRELYNFILLYLIFEEVLVDWSGPTRVGNLFCLRAKDSDYYIRMLENVLKVGDFRHWDENNRYTACNVASIRKFGSLEFRSLQGTNDPELILRWIDILLLLRTKAQTYDNPKEIVEDFHRLGPLPFFVKIFDNKDLRQELEHIPNLSGKLWDGLRMVRDVAYTCEWQAPKPKKKESTEKELDRNLNHRWRSGEPYYDTGAFVLGYEARSGDIPIRFTNSWELTLNDSESISLIFGFTYYYVHNSAIGTRVLLDTRAGPREKYVSDEDFNPEFN